MNPKPQIYGVDGRDVRNIEITIEPAEMPAQAATRSGLLGAH